MKPSKYNVFFKHQGADVGYNCFSREYILLNPLLYDLYKSGIENSDFSDLQNIHLDFYNFLIQQGFLVDETIDEFELVKQLSERIDNDDSSFHLIINPTMNCNFKCWYCYETHIKDSKMDNKTIDAAISLVNNVVKNQKGLKYFHLSFFGGEPLLYFDKVIKPILVAAYEICTKQNILFQGSMTTNGLLVDQKMLDICSKYSLTSFQITLDGCKEQHDKVRFISEGRGSYEKIVQNIILVAKNSLRANVRINISVETLGGLKEILNDFELMTPSEREYISFNMHKVWQVQEKIEMEINDARFSFNNSGFRSVIADEGTVVNSCYGDKRYQATLNYNGEVFKCTARDFKNNSGEGTLNQDGYINWNEKYEKRLNSKFKNAPCKECKILPLCGGGCTQQAIEHEGIDYCVYNFDEELKKQLVLNNFIAMIS
jgi:uncharacterized protein